MTQRLCNRKDSSLVSASGEESETGSIAGSREDSLKETRRPGTGEFKKVALVTHSEPEGIRPGFSVHACGYAIMLNM